MFCSNAGVFPFVEPYRQRRHVDARFQQHVVGGIHHRQGLPRLLTGDFNMSSTYAAWTAFDAFADAAMTRGATTLSEEDNEYASLYDNIWIEESG